MTKRRPYCDDWTCPSLWSCARAYGRSRPYWRFNVEADEREGITWYKGPRNPRRDACEDYERDVAREWLKDAFTPLGSSEPPARTPGQLRLVDSEG